MTDQVATNTNKVSDGFTPVVNFLSSSTIFTDEHGLYTKKTTIPAQNDALPVYIAAPRGNDTLYPIILVVQEIFGVHAHIQDICRRLAKEGYMAIAPELYFRYGDPNQYSDIGELVNKLVSKIPDHQVLSDLDHTAQWASLNCGDSGKLAITGFCWGGRIAWLYAAHNPQLKAAVAWYGKVVGDKSLNSPKHPVDIAADLIAPVLGLYGGKDSSIPQQSIDIVRQALRKAHVEAEIVVYPDAGHAFNADYRESYCAPAAKDGWQRMLNWFTQNGVVYSARRC